MTPTEVRESMAASIRLITCSPKSPGTAALTLLSISDSSSGRLASRKPTPLRRPHHQQREHREDGEVGDAGGVDVAVGVLIALLGPHDAAPGRLQLGPCPAGRRSPGQEPQPVYPGQRGARHFAGTVSAGGQDGLQLGGSRRAVRRPAP